MSTAKSAAIGAAVVATAAGLSALFAYRQNSDYKGISAVGGAVVGAGAASLGGALVAASSRKWHKAGLATTLVGLGGLGALFASLAVTHLLQSGATNQQIPAAPPVQPNPPGAITWTQIAATSTLQPQIVYRLSDAAAPADLQTPPTIDNLNAYLGPMGFAVDGVWVAAPPAGWPAADTAGGPPRIYMEFLVTQAGAQLPSLTSAARLFVQQANQV